MRGRRKSQFTTSTSKPPSAMTGEVGHRGGLRRVGRGHHDHCGATPVRRALRLPRSYHRTSYGAVASALRARLLYREDRHRPLRLAPHRRDLATTVNPVAASTSSRRRRRASNRSGSAPDRYPVPDPPDRRTAPRVGRLAPLRWAHDIGGALGHGRGAAGDVVSAVADGLAGGVVGRLGDLLGLRSLRLTSPAPGSGELAAR